MKNILITGGAGFIGANFINNFLDNNKDCKVFNLDKLSYASDLSNIKNFDKARYEFIEGDICDQSLLTKLFNETIFSGVIHFAAESHVDNSIENPHVFVNTNVIGTLNLLASAYNQWMDSPHKAKAGFENNRFHHISTDEVYGSLGPEGFFTETTPYQPNSPYSASKAGSDFLVRSYFHTYGLNVVTTNCSNNYGPFQHDEKLIPTIIRNAIAGNDIPIYGDGKNVRDWLFVVDHCEAIEQVYKTGLSGETYNIGGNTEKTNLEIVNTICNILDQKLPKSESYSKQISFVKDRPGHDKRYAIDCSKIKNELSWEPGKSFEDGILETIDWYIEKYK